MTATTPGIARAALSSTEASTPPSVGQALTVATFMPGTRTSMPNCVLPLTLSAESTRRSGWPMSLKSFGSFSATLPGIGSLAAAPASAPKPSCRFDAAWLTTPRATVQLAGSTFHCAAAAATSSVRATAPASRSTA